jgi:hypothetical protein
MALMISQCVNFVKPAAATSLGSRRGFPQLNLDLFLGVAGGEPAGGFGDLEDFAGFLRLAEGAEEGDEGLRYHPLSRIGIQRTCSGLSLSNSRR